MIILLVLVAIIMAVSGVSIAAAGIAFLGASWDWVDGLFGLFGIVVGVGLFVGGVILAESQDKYEQQYNRIVEQCAEKGGTINNDSLCIVEGKPIKYSNGEWVWK